MINRELMFSGNAKGAVILRESYEFMRMPCEFRRTVINEEPETFPKVRQNKELSPFPEKTPIGMAYVPYQQWGEVYAVGDGFDRGTMFPELDYPFNGGDCNFE